MNFKDEFLARLAAGDSIDSIMDEISAELNDAKVEFDEKNKPTQQEEDVMFILGLIDDYLLEYEDLEPPKENKLERARSVIELMASFKDLSKIFEAAFKEDEPKNKKTKTTKIPLNFTDSLWNLWNNFNN